MNQDASVTVIVVARNEADNIKACLGAVASQTVKPVEVILVDDGSTDKTVELALAACPGLRVIESPTRSIATNRNVGWRASETEFVAFVDADCEAPANWLENLLKTARRTNADAVGGGNRPPDDEGAHFQALGIMLNTWVGARGSLQGCLPSSEVETDHVPGLNVLYRREALEMIGGFDPRFLRMGEDVDVSTRLRNLGYRLFVSTDATVIHRQRSDLASWARNMRNYGRGRSRLLRRHPNLWSLLFLLPPLMLLALPFYLPAVGVYALWACAKAGKPNLWLRVWALFAATHLPYGLGQIQALFEGGSKRIGLIALKNAGNKGDEALSVCISSRVNDAVLEAGEDVDVYLAGFGPSGLDVRPIPRSTDAINRLVLDLLAPATASRDIKAGALASQIWRSLVVFSRFNALIIAGGQWVHDLSMAKHVIISSMFAFARAFGTKTGVFCIGVGPIQRPISRWLVRRAFGKSSILITRDQSSTKLLHEAGRPKAVTAADPAMELSAAEIEAPAAEILISPCAWASFENIYSLDSKEIERSLENWKALISALQDRGHKLAILPTMNPEDEEFATRIVEGHAIPIIDTSGLTPSQVQGHIAKANALISMRLHPVIFASNCGVSFIALNYAAKVRAFCEQAAMGDRVIDLTERNWAEIALSKLDTKPTKPAEAAQAREDALNRIEDAYSALFDWLDLSTEHRGIAPSGNRRHA